MEDEGGSVAESHIGGQVVILGGNIFALFGESNFRFLLQENQVVVISEIFVLAEGLLVPVAVTCSLDFSLIWQLTLVDQKLKSLWENSAHGGKADIGELIHIISQYTGSLLDPEGIDTQTKREETHSLLLIEQGVHILRSINKR